MQTPPLLRFGRPTLVVGALFWLGAVTALIGCGRRGHDASPGAATSPSKARLKRNVELAPIKREKLTSFVETVGYLDAEGQTDIAAGVSGVVEEVLFREGDWVVKDETLLVRVEPRKY